MMNLTLMLKLAALSLVLRSYSPVAIVIGMQGN